MLSCLDVCIATAAGTSGSSGSGLLTSLQKQKKFFIPFVGGIINLDRTAVVVKGSVFCIKMGHPRPLFRQFLVLSKETLQILRQINVKKVHPGYGAGIRTELTTFRKGQCFWLSWQSGRFQYMRSVVRIQSSAKFYVLNMVTVNCGKDEKIKKKEPGNDPLKISLKSVVVAKLLDTRG